MTRETGGTAGKVKSAILADHRRGNVARGRGRELLRNAAGQTVGRPDFLFRINDDPPADLPHRKGEIVFSGSVIDLVSSRVRAVAPPDRSVARAAIKNFIDGPKLGRIYRRRIAGRVSPSSV